MKSKEFKIPKVLIKVLPCTNKLYLEWTDGHIVQYDFCLIEN